MNTRIAKVFTTMVVASTIGVPSKHHPLYEQTVPCTVYGLYCKETGTMILDEVWCDDHIVYQPSQLSEAEVERFENLLKEAVVLRFDDL